ncbi:MAG: MCP four helix bundle domain-containing protein, partial [Pelobacteraceae bacterium]
MTIRTKLISGFTLLALLLVIVATVGNWGIGKMNRLLDEYARTEGKLVEYAQRGRANINMLRRFEKDAFINIESPGKVAEYVKQWQETVERTVKRLDAMEALLGKLEKGHDADFAKKHKEVVTSLRGDLNTYAAGFNTVIDKIKTGEIKSTQEANSAIGAYKATIHKMEAQILAMAEESDKLMEAGMLEADKIEHGLVITIVSVSLIAVMLAICLIVAILRSIMKPLGAMRAMVTDMAQGEGDLTR